MSASPPDLQNLLCQNKNDNATDSETEEFRKYLEKGGVFDVLTRTFKELYEIKNKPTDPLAHIIKTLGAVNCEAREIEALKDRIKYLLSMIENLENENNLLREKNEENLSD